MSQDIASFRLVLGEDIEDFVGEGFMWPTKLGVDGNIKTQKGSDHISDCNFHNALYRKGDLVEVHSYGGGLWGAIFGVSSENIFATLQNQIVESLKAYENRIEDVHAIVFKGDNDDEVGVRLIYLERQSNISVSHDFKISGVKHE